MSKLLVRSAAAGGIAICALAAGAGTASADTVINTGGGGVTVNTPGPVTINTGGGGVVINEGGGTTYTPGGGGGTPTGGTTPGGGGGTPTTGTPVLASGGTGTTAVSGAATGDALPFTGFEVGTAAAIGLGTLGAGSILIVASRRRRRGTAAI